MAFASKTTFSCPWPGTGRAPLPARLSRYRRLQCVAKAGTIKQLPIFPLNVVALPCATVPLMIFEARYRVLFNTILAGESGVEDGLVQSDSPFCGSRRFGMCYVDGRADPSGASRMASVGTTLEIVDFAHVQDGRIFVTSKGRERFRILSIVKDRPIMIAEVEELPEDEAEGEEVASLAEEVADLLRSTIRLNVKLNNLEASEDQLEPEELAGLGPRDMSYWIASFFGDIKVLQQSLLEENSTVKRLNREKEILSDTVRYYSATVALKSLSVSSPASGDDKAKDS
ncbi:hypothetical protein VaNZ11_003181 [Volvox africanus]|uniref:Lon N-terminal domain-containing protein n=1 Tax=Volvox africanus TaxID=51714 RepID=A0ABQ5RUN9_9CHLO|nr:hypothetical protein VaNZ11_003181 [Volvox africanus]